MSIRDDITPTNPAPIEVLGAQLEAFRKDPSDGSLYVELRAALRKSGQALPLAELGELHAPHQTDTRRAADIWSEAGEARLLLGHDAEGEANLRSALDIDPSNERAAARLSEHLMVAERFAEAADVMECELDALAARAAEAIDSRKQDPRASRAKKKSKSEPFASRRGHRHRMVAQLWDERLGRVDRALHHWQRAWQLEPERTDALDAARNIYASLGDEAMVARLYEAGLEVLGERGNKNQRAAIQLELGRILARQGDAMAAANHLEVALRLDPELLEAREALAEIYSSPTFESKQDRQRRASELFVDLGKRRFATKNDDDAIAYLRRAMGVDPYSRGSAAALEKALTRAERWTELDRLYVHMLGQLEDGTNEDQPAEHTERNQRFTLLNKRGRLYSEHIDDRGTLKSVLLELAATQPPGNEYAKRLRQLYVEDANWSELTELIQRDLPALGHDPAQSDWIIGEILELATIYREHLEDRDRGAELLHSILSYAPNNPEALERYCDHFRERRDWRGLVDLLEFALDNSMQDAQGRRAGTAELVRQLEELAQLSELRLGDIDRAIHTWSRILELEPNNPKAREATRRLASRAKMWQSLVGVLEQEAERAQTPQDRTEALRRIAQVYRERQVNPRRAIALYEEVLTVYPDDAGVLKALSEMYDREGDEAGLAATLRRQLELDVRLMTADQEAGGRRPPTAREWPVAKRVERLTSLRRLATMYEQRLADVEGVVFASTGILEILPGDRDALDRMERVLEKAGDVERLEQTLEYHASSATGPAERAKVLRRLAGLAEERNDEVAAMDRWEKVLKASPNDRDALSALAGLYERHRRFGELAQVLERTLMRARSQTSSGGNTGITAVTDIDSGSLDDKKTDQENSVSPELAAEQVRYARVVDRELGDSARAVRAWRNVLEALPNDLEALESLARLYEASGRWRDLAEILAHQAPLYIDDEPETAANIALKRAALLEHRLGAPSEAAKALEAVISNLDPSNLEAHKALRRLYESRGDFEAAVRIAEREMYLTDDEPQKISRGLEIGLLCRDRLGDPKRALQAFERVLALQGDHEEALTAAADLYAKLGDWKHHIHTLERRIALTGDSREKRALMTRVGHATAEKLSDYKAAFEWFRRAHRSSPDSTTIAELRRAAEAYGLWRDLAAVYADERAMLLSTDGTPLDRDAYLTASRELATISERRLNDRQRAMQVLLETLTITPHEDGLLSEAERLALEANQRPLWKLLLECLAAPLTAASNAASSSDAVAIHLRRARVLEERLEDMPGAVEELLKAFAKQPLRAETRQALYDLAERGKATDTWSGAWSDVVSVEQALFEHAAASTANSADMSAAVHALRCKAQILEERLKERVRAFRVHLQAFLLGPENADTVAHLWRLGRAIQRYREADKRARPEPPAAFVEPATTRPVARRGAPQSVSRQLPQVHVASSSAPTRGDGTEELTTSDMFESHTDPAFELPRADRTMPIDISDLMPDASELAGLDDLHDSFDHSDGSAADATDRSERVHIDEVTAHADDGADPKLDATVDPTMELRTEDLIQALGGKANPAPPPAPDKLGARQSRNNGPPRPPPRPPKIKRRSVTPVPPVPASRSQPGSSRAGKRRHLRMPRMPERTYETPWEEFATAYEQLDAPDTETALRWLFKAAEVWETGAENIRTAFDVLARAVARAEDSAEPRARLQRLAADHGEWDRLAALYQEAAEEADTAEAVVALLLEVAEIRGQQNRPQETETIFRRILGIRPDDSSVRDRLDALYRSEERWVDLAASLEERTDPRLGSAAPAGERPGLLRELARLYSERLTRPRDAIDALGRLLELHPDDLQTLQQLADLHASIGRWSKVIDTMNRIADITAGTGVARDALREIARIYEEELELPDRAIDSYTQIIANWSDDSDAYAALDRLYQSHARWHDLSETLRRRAGLAREPKVRADLLRRRAKVLMEWLDSADEAAAALRHARTIVGSDDANYAQHAELADDLVEALIRAGREREAIAVLEGRISAMEKKEAGDGDVAALMIRLAGLRADHLNDFEGAHRLLETALKRVPNHPTALSTLARLAEGEKDPRAYADARLREADAHQDIDHKVEALLDAGATLTERVGDTAAARAAFERVLELRPYHAQATWALAGLVEQGGDIQSATALLEGQLDDESHEEARDPRERARILTQLAALARQAGVDAAAEHRLEEALQAVPNHLPAILRMADLLGESERYESLESFIRDVAPRLEEEPAAPTSVRAELQRRLAVASEQLGRDDEAYQTLLAADRLHRGSLLIKLALGENRYRARRWREAALHLSVCAEHDEAENHPAEVAKGLYHAALAEIRSLRPEKAASLYERAIELKPNFAPALHALAELAMEHGNPERAADLLTRQAESSEDPSERMKLFEALGDMALLTLSDETRAQGCYQLAVASAAPLEARHLPLLEKLLERQDIASDHLNAAKTAELMASFGEDASARAARYTSAAESYLAAGDRESATVAADKAVDAAPYDLTAVTVLTDLLLSSDEHERAAKVLGRALSGDANPQNAQDGDGVEARFEDEATLARKSLLWYRLADARLTRGDEKGGNTALHKALSLASDSDGAMAARRRFIELWSSDRSHLTEVLEFHATLAADSIAVEDIAAYARALRAAGEAGASGSSGTADYNDGALAMLELAELQGYTLTERDRKFLASHEAHKFAADEGYRGQLSADLRATLIDDPREEPLASVLSALWESAALLWSEADDALERCMITSVHRVSATSTFRAASIFPRVAAALDIPATMLHRTEAPAADDARVVCVSPPLVVLGPRFQTGGDISGNRTVGSGHENHDPGSSEGAPSELELRFVLGRTAELCRPRRVIAAGLPREDFTGLLQSVARVFGRDGLATEPADDASKYRDEMLRTTLPVKLRTRLSELLENLTPRDLDPERYLVACQRAADRAGLLVCGDIATAARYAGTMSGDGRRITRHLVQLALNPAYLSARAALGIGSQKS